MYTDNTVTFGGLCLLKKKTEAVSIQSSRCGYKYTTVRYSCGQLRCLSSQYGNNACGTYTAYPSRHNDGAMGSGGCFEVYSHLYELEWGLGGEYNSVCVME